MRQIEGGPIATRLNRILFAFVARRETDHRNDQVRTRRRHSLDAVGAGYVGDAMLLTDLLDPVERSDRLCRIGVDAAAATITE